MLKRIVTMIAVGCFMGANAGTQDRSVQIQKTLDTILSKSGISVGGEFKSQYFGATIGGDGSDSTKRTSESNEFTSVDFDIKARPNDNVTGRVVFRMHQNWQNFFSDISNPIFTRWLSIDGGARDMFRFNVGDYRAQYSPLTLYTPEIDIMYEPYVFARERQLAMDEAFIGNNDRILQGVNFGFDAEIAPLFDEFHYSLSAARLRTNETSIQNGSMIVNGWESARPFSNYYNGTNLDMTFLKGVNLGGSFLAIFDHKGSYNQQNAVDTLFADTAAQMTRIISARPGVDVSKLMQNKVLTLNINAEAAFSIDDSTWSDSAGLSTESITGKAIRGGVAGGYRSEDQFNVLAHIDFIMNDDLFRNEMAQSPAFLPSRIMNLENDLPAALQHYSTFDALYHSVFKFTPQIGTNRWAKAPFRKNSWTRTIYNQRELGMLSQGGGLDPNLGLVMPFGPATPNRQGITADLSGSALTGAIEAKAQISLLSEKDLYKEFNGTDSVEFPATSFSQMGGGLKVDISKFLPGLLPYPVELSGSMMLSSASNDGLADTSMMAPKTEITSNFINAGLSWKFFKRASLVGGFQRLETGITSDTNSSTCLQTHWTGGLEWKVSQGADVIVSYGQIIIDDDPDYPGVLRLLGFAVPASLDFTQDLINLSLRVRF